MIFLLKSLYVVQHIQYIQHKGKELMIKLHASKARINLSDILNKVAFKGERVILHRYDKDLAAVISMEELQILDHALNEEKRAKEMENATLQLAAIVESSDDAIIGKTLDGVITSWNPGAENLYGYSANEVINKTIAILIPPYHPNEIPQFLESISNGERVKHYETKRMRKDGKQIDVSLTISPIKDLRGNIIGASTIAHDITERKRAEEELKASREQLRSLSTRLQILQEKERERVAHELQEEVGQALTALKLELAWLRKRMPVNREPFQKKIDNAIHLLDTTIHAMRKVSTDLRPAALDDLGLVAAIEGEIAEFQKRTGIECFLTVQPETISIDSAHSIGTFRILQETLNSVASHTKVTRIDIKILVYDNILFLEMENIGDDISNPASLDLASIQERALLLGGEVQIKRSTKEFGINARIPIQGQQSLVIKKRSQLSLKEEATKPAHNPKPYRKFKKLDKDSNIAILIADSHAVVREGLKQILAEIPDVVVNGEASNGQEVLQQVRTGRWDVLVMDISLPDKNGLDVLKQIKDEYPTLPVLILSAQTEEQYALRVLKAGASGFLTKESAADQLIEAVQKVAKGGQYVSDAVAERLIFGLRVDTEKPLHKTLSDREFQVLCMIASGKRLTEIAQELHLSIKTVSTHRAKLLQKMGMSSNVELVHYAIENNLIR